MGGKRKDKQKAADVHEVPFAGNDLTYYLVSRFIVVLVCVMAAESAVVWLESTVLLPALQVLAEEQVAEAQGTTSIVVLLQGLWRLVCAMTVAGSVQLAPAMMRSLVFALVVTMLLLLLVPLVVGAIAFSVLVVRRVRALQMRREQEIARMEQQRSQFITDVAHDLRTPLMAISGMVHALSDGLVQGQEMQAEYLQSISDKADKMSGLVSSVFDYAKLGNAGFSLQRERVDFSQLLLREAATAYTDAEDAGIELTVHVPEAPCMVDADPLQLGRVVANLLANAIRHNPAGTEVALMMVIQAGIAYAVVADSGAVITQDQDDLFQPFTRGDASRSAAEGSGLGLSICKRVADMHGFGLSLVQPYGRFPKAFVLSCPVED